MGEPTQAMLVDTLHWNEADVAQIKRDLEFINRNTH
jgi:hypothetical protein